MEGKEVRFGQAMTAAYAAVTTGLSDGGVNGMHGSFTGLGGLVPMFLIQLGEVLPGGVGSGLYGMLVFAILDRLRRRPDGRPHAGTARQEDRKPRDEIRHARGADPAAGDPRLHRRLRDAALRGQPASAQADRMACRRSSMPTPPPPATTARPSAG